MDTKLGRSIKIIFGAKNSSVELLVAGPRSLVVDLVYGRARVSGAAGEALVSVARGRGDQVARAAKSTGLGSRAFQVLLCQAIVWHELGDDLGRSFAHQQGF